MHPPMTSGTAVDTKMGESVAAEDLNTGCIISEFNHYGTPEMERWDAKYCHQHWQLFPEK